MAHQMHYTLPDLLLALLFTEAKMVCGCSWSGCSTCSCWPNARPIAKPNPTNERRRVATRPTASNLRPSRRGWGLWPCGCRRYARVLATPPCEPKGGAASVPRGLF